MPITLFIVSFIKKQNHSQPVDNFFTPQVALITASVKY